MINIMLQKNSPTKFLILFTPPHFEIHFLHLNSAAFLKLKYLMMKNFFQKFELFNKIVCILNFFSNFKISTVKRMSLVCRFQRMSN